MRGNILRYLGCVPSAVFIKSPRSPWGGEVSATILQMSKPNFRESLENLPIALQLKTVRSAHTPSFYLTQHSFEDIDLIPEKYISLSLNLELSNKFPIRRTERGGGEGFLRLSLGKNHPKILLDTTEPTGMKTWRNLVKQSLFL